MIYLWGALSVGLELLLFFRMVLKGRKGGKRAY